MRNRYDMQLHLLDTQLTHMGELCETAIAKVTQALKEGNTEQAKIVIKDCLLYTSPSTRDTR